MDVANFFLNLSDHIKILCISLFKNLVPTYSDKQIYWYEQTLIPQMHSKTIYFYLFITNSISLRIISIHKFNLHTTVWIIKPKPGSSVFLFHRTSQTKTNNVYCELFYMAKFNFIWTISMSQLISKWWRRRFHCCKL